MIVSLPLIELVQIATVAMTWLPGVALCLAGLAILIRRGRKGDIGEKKVARILARFGCPRINDAVFETADGSTQIDHLALTHEGILVIETKTWRGELALDGQAESAETWSLVPHKGARAYQEVANPVRQNAHHMRAVRALVGQDAPLCNIVCFADPRMRFAFEKPAAAVTLEELEAFLTSIEASKPVGDSGLKLAWAKLESAARVDAGSRRRHGQRLGAESWRVRALDSLWLFAGGAGALVAAYYFWLSQGFFFS